MNNTVSANDRLAVVMNAATGLARTLADRGHKDETTQLAHAIQEMSNIVDLQKQLHLAASRNRYGYVNWNASHEDLETHSYISLKDFDENFRRYIREHDEFEDEDEEFGYAMVNMLNKGSRVNKTTRFPAGGKFINIKLQKLEDHIETILFAIEHGGDMSLGRWGFHVFRLVEKVDDLVLNNGDGVYDLDNFEKKYKLKWENISN